jgi:hypothetical protein
LKDAPPEVYGRAHRQRSNHRGYGSWPIKPASGQFLAKPVPCDREAPRPRPNAWQSRPVHPPPARIAASYWEIKELSHVESRRDTPVTERGRHCRRRCSASVLRSVARARHEATPQSPALKTRKPGRSHSAGGPRSTAESPRTELISGRGGRPAGALLIGCPLSPTPDMPSHTVVAAMCRFCCRNRRS